MHRTQLETRQSAVNVCRFMTSSRDPLAVTVVQGTYGIGEWDSQAIGKEASRNCEVPCP